MKCSICKKNYPDIHEIHHGEEIHFMCSKSWNDMLADLDPTVDAMILPDFCPDEDTQFWNDMLDKLNPDEDAQRA